MRRIYFLFLIIGHSACQLTSSTEKSKEWSKDLCIYEIMPRQYSSRGDFKGITADLSRIQSLFFNAICLLPIAERDESNNPFNPGSPFAIKDFSKLDPSLGTPEDLKQLLDSAHVYGIKVLLEWNFNLTGPHHEWRTKHPEYYMSNEKMIDNRYNQDYVRLNLENKSLQQKLLSELKAFIKKHQIDGVVLYDMDQVPASFTKEVTRNLGKFENLLLINHSDQVLAEFHYNMTNSWYSKFHQIYESATTVDNLMPFLDSIMKFGMINFIHDYNLNDRFASEVNVFYNADKYFQSLAFFLPGIHWVLNGQEDPQFDRISIFSTKQIVWKFKYNNDFYRSLNYQKQKNPALWNSDTSNHPKLISNSQQVLAMERKSGNACIVGLFNLTDQPALFKINSDYKSYYELFNKVPVNFMKDTDLQLGPYQAILFSNVP